MRYSALWALYLCWSSDIGAKLNIICMYDLLALFIETCVECFLSIFEKIYVGLYRLKKKRFHD
jgi:hypothetical protein